MKRMIMVSLLMSCSAFGMESNGQHSNEQNCASIEWTKEQKSDHEVREVLAQLARHMSSMSEEIAKVGSSQTISAELLHDLRRFTMYPGIEKTHTLLARADAKHNERYVEPNSGTSWKAVVSVAVCGAALYYHFYGRHE